MKKILLITLLLISTIAYSQDFKELFNRIGEFDKQEQFDKVDDEILIAVNYLLTHPYKEKSEKYFFALKSMITWMNGTANYHIIIGGKIVEDCGNDTLMINMYMASMAKYLLIEHLENDRYIHPVKIEGKKYTDLDEVREIMFEGAKIFMEYLTNKSEIKISKGLKKTKKKYDKGLLYEYMFE